MNKKINTTNWEKIQKFYNENYCTWQILSKKFKISINLISEASKLGIFISRSRSESIRLRNKIFKRPIVSEETKLKISKARKKFLQENPDKVPYLLNHFHSRKFYSEEYFEKCLKGSDFLKSVREGTYLLDFADVERKIDLEIDGEQHFVDPKILEHDKKRNKFLGKLGYKIIRVRWSKFKKMEKENKELIISSIIKGENPNIDCVLFLDENFDLDLSEKYFFKKNNKKASICECGRIKTTQSTNCTYCCGLMRRKIKWPTLNSIFLSLETMTWENLARKLNVSSNAIRGYVKREASRLLDNQDSLHPIL